MNERIKELAKQAGASQRAGVGGLVFRDSELEKFAGLIVKECIEQCTANDSNDEWDKGVRWAANQIKEHFKVDI